jgi:hypothetical protein
MRGLIASALLLSACTTTIEGMANQPPASVYHSAKAREAIIDCLLNRVGSDELRPQRTEAEHATTLGFTGPGIARKPAMYLFTIRDEEKGAAVEVRRQAGMSLANAETCF